MSVIQRPAHERNFTRGREGTKIDMLIIHVSQGTMAGMAAWFGNPQAQVSAHYGISKTGEVHQYLADEDTGWHAGDWNINLRSIGIEHEGLGADYTPTEAQLIASAQLAARLCRRYDIMPSRLTIRPHRDFKATACPAQFPMQYYTGMVKGITLC